MSTFKPGRPSRQTPPDKPGVYYARNKDTRAADYIGETASLKRRMAQHIIVGTFSLVTHWFEWKQADGRSTSSTRRQHERGKIARHKPDLNKRAGGGGRKSKI